MPENRPRPIAKEDMYRALDALYRIHEDLFQVEEKISRLSSALLTVAKLRGNTFLGALAAGLLVIAPILVSVLDIKWSSAPVIAVFLVVGGVIALWIYQAYGVASTRKELGFIAGSTYQLPLELRHDYLREVIATWGNRKRVLEEVILELKARCGDGEARGQIAELRHRLARYESISEECLYWIRWAVKTSANCLAQEQRSEAEHAEILDWAKPFIVSGDKQNGGEEKNSEDEASENRDD